MLKKGILGRGSTIPVMGCGSGDNQYKRMGVKDGFDGYVRRQRGTNDTDNVEIEIARFGTCLDR